MDSRWIPRAIVGVILALLVIEVVRLEQRTGTSPAAAVPGLGHAALKAGSGPPPADLTRRVDALEWELADLRHQLADEQRAEMLARLPGGIAADRGRPASSDEEAEGEPDPVEVVAAALAEEDPVITERVQRLVRSELEREEEQRHQRRKERWAERQDEMLQKLTSEADLDDDTVAQLGQFLTAEREEIGALARSAREGGQGFRAVREKIGQVHQGTDDNARAVLDDDAFARFLAAREEQNPWRRGRRGGGDNNNDDD